MWKEKKKKLQENRGKLEGDIMVKELRLRHDKIRQIGILIIS